jgi:ABC-type phosphate transport system permease subunit
MPTTILGGGGKAEAWVTKKQSPRTGARSTIIKAFVFIFCLLSSVIVFFISIPASIALALYVEQLSCQDLCDRLNFGLID